jgi:4-carboxymuconolactone decarboxylase
MPTSARAAMVSSATPSPSVATLVALYRGNELRFHLRKALENGLSRDELIEVITPLAFRAGWPNAMSAMMAARGVFARTG